jgi:hypothetical protein
MSDVLDFARLDEIAQHDRQSYRDAVPFPHIVLDEVLSPKLMLEAARRFPPASDPVWYRYANPLETKLAMPEVRKLPSIFGDIVRTFNSDPFVCFLESLTDITGLIADAECYGGGLHQIERGGKLDVHADFNIHPVTKLNRRVNLILYLNPDWKEEYGGHLELWDAQMTRAQQRILTIANRMVVFTTTDVSYHGHPDPLDCPAGCTRKSMAVYYYSKERRQNEVAPPHSTLYKPRPHDPADSAMDDLRRRRASGRLA